MGATEEAAEAQEIEEARDRDMEQGAIEQQAYNRYQGEGGKERRSKDIENEVREARGEKRDIFGRFPENRTQRTVVAARQVKSYIVGEASKVGGGINEIRKRNIKQNEIESLRARGLKKVGMTKKQFNEYYGVKEGEPVIDTNTGEEIVWEQEYESLPITGQRKEKKGRNLGNSKIPYPIQKNSYNSIFPSGMSGMFKTGLLTPKPATKSSSVAKKAPRGLLEGEMLGFGNTAMHIGQPAPNRAGGSVLANELGFLSKKSKSPLKQMGKSPISRELDFIRKPVKGNPLDIEYGLKPPRKNSSMLDKLFAPIKKKRGRTGGFF